MTEVVAPTAAPRWQPLAVDLLGFAVGLGMALAFDWRAADLVWSLWLSSLVLGWLTIVGSIAGGAVLEVRARGRNQAPRVVLTAAGLLAFFTVHFGFFHLVHSVFLMAFFPIGGGAFFPGLDDYAHVAASYWPWLLAAAIAERRKLASALRTPLQATPGGPPFGPLRAYANVVRMHMLIFFFLGAAFLHLDNAFVYAVVFAVYFLPWRLLLRPAHSDASPQA